DRRVRRELTGLDNALEVRVDAVGEVRRFEERLRYQGVTSIRGSGSLVTSYARRGPSAALTSVYTWIHTSDAVVDCQVSDGSQHGTLEPGCSRLLRARLDRHGGPLPRPGVHGLADPAGLPAGEARGARPHGGLPADGQQHLPRSARDGPTRRRARHLTRRRPAPRVLGRDPVTGGQ